MSMGFFGKFQLKKLIHPDFQDYIPGNQFWFYEKHFRKNFENVKRFQYLDINTFMAELVLTKIDRASMANSLEVRVPFLDHTLVEYMFSLDESNYISYKHKKLLLYENIKNQLPQSILNRKKQGFVGPDSYYKNNSWYKEIILNGKLIENGIINKDYCNQLLIINDQWRLWKIAIMELWYSKWS
jgi:asparagine synthase (glutamine-hydrolysing)